MQIRGREVRGEQGEGMRVLGGQEELAEERELPATPAVPAAPSQGLGSLTTLFSPHRPCLLFAWRELFIFATATFHSVKVRASDTDCPELEELSRPWSLLLPRVGLAVS